MTFDVDKNDWTQVAFGDVVKNVNVTSKNLVSEDLNRFIGLEHLDSGKLKVQRFGDTSEGVTFTKIVSPGQTLFGKRRVYQRKVAFADFKAVCSGDILTFEPSSNLLLESYLPFLVMSESFFHRALSTSAGSLSPRTRWSDLAKFQFLLPPIEVQQKISNLLWAIQTYLDNLAIVEIHLRKFWKSLEISFYGELDLGFKLGALVEINPDQMNNQNVPGSFLYIDISSVSAMENIDMTKLRVYDRQSAPSRAQRLVTQGDVLVSTVRPLQKSVAAVPYSKETLVASSGLAVLRANSDSALSILEAIVYGDYFAESMQSRSTGTSYPAIRPLDIQEFCIPDPDSSSTKRRCEQINEVRKVISSIRIEMEELNSLFLSIMSRVFPNSDVIGEDS